MALENCPARLLADASGEYDRIAKVVLQHADKSTLEVYCVTYAKWREAERTLEREGSTYTLKSGVIKPHPAALMARQYSNELMKMARQLALTGRYSPMPK